ncbi:MAG: MBL fold metallo-hydrolase, partial [Verrucomicrobia bacterium]|nr:MBL fold metallo-hydrolase [Verrucomicrobiota bacterium]
MPVNPVIKGVLVVPMGMSNAYLIESDDGITLVDAGFPSKEALVFDAIRGLGRSLDQLKHLIFTHGHPDHIGSAAAIVRETGARTYMHPLDIPMAESGGPFRPMRPAPGLLRQVMCRLFYDHNKRVAPVAIDQPLSDSEILPIGHKALEVQLAHLGEHDRALSGERFTEQDAREYFFACFLRLWPSSNAAPTLRAPCPKNFRSSWRRPWVRGFAYGHDQSDLV